MTDTTSTPDTIDYMALNGKACPWDEYASLYDLGVLRSESLTGFFGVLSHDLLREAAADHERLTTRQGATIPRVTDPDVPAVPLEADPPESAAYRRLLQGPLRPKHMDAYVDVITSITRDWLAEHATTGSTDLHGLAELLPGAVIAHVLGLPREDVTDFVGWSNSVVEGTITNNPQLQLDSVTSLMGYIFGKLAQCREQPGDGLLSTVANAEIDGEPIADGAAAGAVVLLIMAGHETTTDGLSWLIHQVATVPGLKQTLLQHPERIDDAIEESLRIESPVQFMGRTATQDMEIGGCPVAKGEAVAMMWGPSNHDPSKFEDPDVFDLDRDTTGHLAFGHGVHRCVGEHLARLEMRVAMREILAWMPDYEMVGDLVLKKNVATTRGPAVLDVTFTPPRG